MASDGLRFAARLGVVAAGAGSGVAAALHAMPATTAVGLLGAAWAAASAWMRHASLRRSSIPAPPPARPSGDAGETRRLAVLLDLSPAPLVSCESSRIVRPVNRAARQLLEGSGVRTLTDGSLGAAIAAAIPGSQATVAVGARTFALATADVAAAGSQTRLAALLEIGAELRETEARTLRELLQVLHHELVNTLTPIASLGQSAVFLLDEAGEEVSAARDAMETVARRTEALQRFAESFTSLARLPAPDRHRIDLRELLGDLARLFGRRWPAIELEVKADRRPVHVVADAGQLHAALWALLQNAAEAMSDVPVGRLGIALEQDLGSTRVVVSDNGPGITPSDREAIFRPFFTRKATGGGIGLALARQILRAHHGDLVVRDGGQRGAVFVACLPAS